MPMRIPQIRKLVGGIGVFVALAIAVAVPVGTFAVGYAAASDVLTFKARLSASQVAQFIYTNQRLWQYQHVRLAGLLELPSRHGESVRERIVDPAGNVILQEAGILASPLQRVRVPIVVRGETVAWLEAEASLRPLAVSTGFMTAISSILGLIAWLTVRLLPLRVLEATLLTLARQSARFQAALDNMTQGLCLFDAQRRLVVHNRRFAEMFGTPKPETAASGELTSRMLRDLGMGGTFAPADANGLQSHDEAVHKLPDGRVIQESRRAIPGEGWVATYEDVSERRRSQDQLSHMARHDALTDLPNRVLFREHMERVLPRVRRGDHVAVLYLDLDGFKAVNDMHGHPAGDELLRRVAAILRENTRETDLVARLGGDEFAIIQVGAAQPSEQVALADRLLAAIRVPFEIVGQRVEIGVSIGIALADATSSSVDRLLRNADIALYRAKAGGRGKWCFFEPEMDEELQHRYRLDTDLRCALTEGQFEVYYQPLIEARTQLLAGFEALIRWHHPNRGMVLPAEFIPLSEENGLIRAIGGWVLATACADAVRWPEHIKLAVNLSPVQFANGNLVQEVTQALDRSGLAASRLELEITESVLLQDNNATLGILHQLHNLGVRISMDDFGTGYSSLSYLRRFPFDKIKIDQSFVRDLARENGSIEIVRAVVGLGRALGMSVLAEGVETAEQLGLLQAEGCDELQGYLFSKPRPVRDVPAIIARHSVAGDS